MNKINKSVTKSVENARMRASNQAMNPISDIIHDSVGAGIWFSVLQNVEHPVCNSVYESVAIYVNDKLKNYGKIKPHIRP